MLLKGLRHEKMLWLVSSMSWMLTASTQYDCQVCKKHEVKTTDFDTEYVIARLNPHIGALIQFNKNNEKLNPGFNTLISVINDGAPALAFTHELIKLCAKKMEKLGSLEPLFETWRFFKQSFKNVEPHIFLR